MTSRLTFGKVFFTLAVVAHAGALTGCGDDDDGPATGGSSGRSGGASGRAGAAGGPSTGGQGGRAGGGGGASGQATGGASGTAGQGQSGNAGADAGGASGAGGAGGGGANGGSGGQGGGGANGGSGGQGGEGASGGAGGQGGGAAGGGANGGSGGQGGGAAGGGANGGAAGSGASGGAGGQGGAANNPIDTSFGKDGFVTFEQFPSFTYLQDFALGPDSSIYLIGNDIVGDLGSVAHALVDGSLDPAFGEGGLAPYGGTFIGFSVAAGADGKVVVGGADITAPVVLPAFARLLADGAPDATFGDGGYAAVDLGGAEGRAFDVALRDNAIIAVGNGQSGEEFAVEAFAMRARADGSLDPTFNAPDGFHYYVPEPAPPFVSEYMYATHVRADGSFYSCGTGLNFTSPSESDFDFLVLRYAPDGTLDPSFGQGGAVRLDRRGVSDGVYPVQDNNCYAVAETPDGKIVLGGDAVSAEFFDQAKFVVARLNADGTPDASFGDGGFFDLDLGPLDRLTGLVVLPDGSIAASGFTGDPFGEASPVVFVVRPDGTLAPSFGTGGVFKLELPQAGVSPLFIGRQADGKLVLAGSAPTPFLARLNAP